MPRACSGVTYSTLLRGRIKREVLSSRSAKLRVMSATRTKAVKLLTAEWTKCNERAESVRLAVKIRRRLTRGSPLAVEVVRML